MKFGPSPFQKLNWKHFKNDINPYRATFYGLLEECDIMFEEAEGTRVTGSRYGAYQLLNNLAIGIQSKVKAIDAKNYLSLCYSDRYLVEVFHQSFCILKGSNPKEIERFSPVKENLRKYAAYIIWNDIETLKRLKESFPEKVDSHQTIVQMTNQLSMLGLNQFYQHLCDRKQQGRHNDLLSYLHAKTINHTAIEKSFPGENTLLKYEYLSKEIHGQSVTVWNNENGCFEGGPKPFLEIDDRMYNSNFEINATFESLDLMLDNLWDKKSLT